MTWWTSVEVGAVEVEYVGERNCVWAIGVGGVAAERRPWTHLETSWSFRSSRGEGEGGSVRTLSRRKVMSVSMACMEGSRGSWGVVGLGRRRRSEGLVSVRVCEKVWMSSCEWVGGISRVTEMIKSVLRGYQSQTLILLRRKTHIVTILPNTPSIPSIESPPFSLTISCTACMCN